MIFDHKKFKTTVEIFLYRLTDIKLKNHYKSISIICIVATHNS